MRIYKLDPNNATDKTSILYALRKGYQFKLDVDGCAEVISPQGEAYYVKDFRCNCPDSLCRNGGSYTLADTERHACKHTLWVSQLCPCPKCQAGYMMMRFDLGWRVFQCTTPQCFTMIPFLRVQDERREAYRQREQEADMDRVVTVTEPPDALEARAAHASQVLFG